jgi:hypothetical protein
MSAIGEYEMVQSGREWGSAPCDPRWGDLRSPQTPLQGSPGLPTCARVANLSPAGDLWETVI